MLDIRHVLVATVALLAPGCLFDADTNTGADVSVELGDLGGDCTGDPVVFRDTEFAAGDWTVLGVDATAGATHEAEQDATSGLGNPGAFRRMVHDVPYAPPLPEAQAALGSIEVQHVYAGPSEGGESTDGSYDPAALGPIDRVEISLDRRLIDASPVDDAVLLVQAGTVYRALPGTVAEFAWTTATATLAAADFDAGGAHPDFSAAGAPIRFGYLRASRSLGMHIHGIDNWSVTVHRAGDCCVDATVSLHVAEGAVGPGRGTLFSPFGSIAQALDEAAARNYCSVFIVVGEGSYEGDLEITRDTYITGTNAAGVRITGTIRNRAGAHLSLEDVTLANGDGAAVDIEHPEASTVLSGVVIEGASGTGLRQVGGTLTISHCAIDGARRPAPATPDAQGIGLFLRDVEATIVDTSLSANDFQAIVVEGPEAAATLRNVTVLETGLNVQVEASPGIGQTEAFDGYAAVEVRDGAVLVADGLDLFDNANIGVSVHDGARVDLTHLFVTNTRGTALYGVGLQVDGAAASVTHFDIGFSDFIAVSLSRGAMVSALTDGLVHDNVIGLYADGSIDIRGIDIARTVFVDNEINLDSPTLPIPDGTPPPLP